MVILKKHFSTFFAVVCTVVLSACLCTSAYDSERSAGVYSDILRLHIIANSDSYADQSLKYKVRDEVTPLFRDLFSECGTVTEALEIAHDNKALFETAARRVLEQNGGDRRVNVSVGKAYYPEKTLGDSVFPEGEYLSMRVVLGDGDGRNWWCVLFPSLCDVGIESEEKALNDTEQDDGGIEIFGCRVKLKILDFLK